MFICIFYKWNSKILNSIKDFPSANLYVAEFFPNKTIPLKYESRVGWSIINLFNLSTQVIDLKIILKIDEH